MFGLVGLNLFGMVCFLGMVFLLIIGFLSMVECFFEIVVCDGVLLVCISFVWFANGVRCFVGFVSFGVFSCSLLVLCNDHETFRFKMIQVWLVLPKPHFCLLQETLPAWTPPVFYTRRSVQQDQPRPPVWP